MGELIGLCVSGFGCDDDQGSTPEIPPTTHSGLEKKPSLTTCQLKSRLKQTAQ